MVNKNKNLLVGILMGSQSDWEVMKEAKDQLDEFSISNEQLIISAHRTPTRIVDYAKKVSSRISKKKSEIGILVCGSGTGMAISANKTKGIRAAVGYNAKSTQLSRQHNNANVLCLGSRLTKRKDIKKIIKIFLNTKFDGGRHKRRVKKI